MSITLQMTMSYLVPGAAEKLKRSAKGDIKHDSYQVASVLQRTRNILYVSIALSAIACIGAIKTTGTKFYSLATVAVLSGTCAVLTFAAMHEFVDGVKSLILKPSNSKQ